MLLSIYYYYIGNSIYIIIILGIETYLYAKWLIDLYGHLRSVLIFFRLKAFMEKV